MGTQSFGLRNPRLHINFLIMLLVAEFVLAQVTTVSQVGSEEACVCIICPFSARSAIAKLQQIL